MATKAKMEIPSASFTTLLEPGKMKAITESATSKLTEYMVPVAALRTIPGFNVRVRDTADYRGHLDALKGSIRENGFYSNKPLAGYIGKDGDDDVIYVTDGHTRLEAVQEINAEALDAKEEIAAVPVALKPKDSSLDDLTIALVQENSGRPLTPYEMGIVVRRLTDRKDGEGNAIYQKADIARKLSITERYVDDLMVLTDAPKKVRDHVLAGKVSSTLAIQELRKSPAKAAERIDAAVKKAEASGKKKATRKDIGTVRMQKVRFAISMATGTPMGEVLKAVAAKAREIVPHAAKDDGDGLTVDGTFNVTLEIPAPDKPKAEPKPKAAAKPKAESKPKATAKPKAAAAAKPKAEPKPKADTAKKKDAAKAEVTSGDDADGEVAKLPPAVPGVDAGGDPDDI